MKIISTAPTRLSLFGGGTDVNPYAEEYGGVCINMAINLRQEIIINESLAFSNIPPKASVDFYKAFFKEFDYYSAFSATFDSVIESGLGSSASAAIALIGAINKAKNLGMTRAEIAEKAWEIEVNKLKLYGGKQDQYAAAFGGFNTIHFNNEVTVDPFEKDAGEWIKDYLMLVYTGKNRKSSVIQEGFKKLSKEQVRALNKLKKNAYEAISYIEERNIRGLAKLLRKTWEAKKLSNKGVTNAKIDKIYNLATKSGAMAGKICGAGGGGFMVLMVSPQNRARLKKVLKETDFDICWNGLSVRRID